jgi:N-methylhydantoinase A/oxoprolinase/acetone carboxylase beta subunit
MNGAPAGDGRKGSRQIRWDNGETLDTPIFSEDALRPGRRIAGPALIESPITNYAVAPGWLLDLDRWGNLRFARA